MSVWEDHRSGDGGQSRDEGIVPAMPLRMTAVPAILRSVASVFASNLRNRACRDMIDVRPAKRSWVAQEPYASGAFCFHAPAPGASLTRPLPQAGDVIQFTNRFQSRG